MKCARQSDAVSWWKMGRTAALRHGLDKALQMSDDIKSSGARLLWRNGALGQNRPVRRQKT